MTAPIKLHTLVKGLDAEISGATTYLEIPTGKVFMVTQQMREAAQDYSVPLDNRPSWMQEEIERVWNLQDNPTDYLPLPSKEQIDLLGIMEQFINSIESREAHHYLFSAIKGKKAYHQFKAGLAKFNIEDNWQAYKESLYREILREWCRVNEVDFAER